MPVPVIGVPSPVCPKMVQARRPTTPGKAKTVRAICQSISLANGAAVATDNAIPRLKPAVVTAFITVTSLGLNQSINNGPVPVRMNANPKPMADRNNSRLVKLGATPESDTSAMAAQPMKKERFRPIRAIKIPLGKPAAAATNNGRATNNPAVARLMSYSSMAIVSKGETAKTLSPTLKCPVKINTAITKRYLL